MTTQPRPDSTMGLGLISIEMFSDLAVIARDPAENFDDILRALRGEQTALSKYIVPLSSKEELVALHQQSDATKKIQAEFDEWYQAYPLKKGRGQAERAYKAARKRVNAEVLLTAAEKFAATVDRNRLSFCPHPATWLNGQRWDDEETPADRQPPPVGKAHVYPI